MTYDPHVSSPFMSPSPSPRPLNPNTKWFINIASVTNIRLLSIARSYRCFPYSDSSKELSIQTNDGRNVVLRASKEIELDRWYFVLSKIWEYRQQKSEAASESLAARNLAAHQQSAQLFQKYLQKQYPDPQQEQHQVQRSSSNLLRSHQNMPRESLLPYQIPPPPRVSAFLPQGLEFSLQEQDDEDDIPARFLSSYYESQSVTDEKGRPPLDRRGSWSQQRQAQGSVPVTAATRRRDDINRSASAGMVHQRSDCPTANSMEPGKAAIIDNWRRSLLIPKHVEEKTSMKSGESGRDLAATRDMDRTDGDTLSDLADLRADSRDMESTLKHSSLGLEYGILCGAEIGMKVGELDPPHGLGIWTAPNEEDIDDNTPVGQRRSFYGVGLSEERSFQGNKRSSHLPGLTMQLHQKEKDLQRSGGHTSQDETIQDLKILSADMPNPETKEEDELPLGLIQVKRQSRWLNTQLSSEDGASPITPGKTPVDLGNNAHSQPTMTRLSRDMQREHHPLDVHRLTPSLSNPSLSLHGSSYSHLPIHDPDFVFPKLTQNAYSSANEHPTMGFDEPCKVTQSAATVPAIPAADRGLFTVRNLRRGFSIPTPTTGSSGQTPSKKYVAVDTTPYTSITTMNSNPPPRPTRPQDVNLSPLLPESDHAFLSQAQFASQSANVRLATFKQQHHRKQPSLSRSISAMSSVSQAHLRRQSSQPQLASPYQPHSKLLNNRVGDEEDDNEPLGLSLSRQQSNKQQRRLSHRIYPDQRPISMVSQISPAALMRVNSGAPPTMLQPNFEQAPLRASSASFSYF
ncbi:hypothetical protein BGX26_003777 [Mortierella sp. AD094]|nr:hypothetical protein BGX26_003777 [Mortierella sp. AD094]